MQQYTQPVSYGITSYELKQWMSVAFVQDSIRVSDQLTLDAGLRYDRQTLTDATKNFAPRARLRLASERRFAPGRFAAATAMYYTQIRANALASALTGGLDGLVDLHGDARADRVPDLPDRTVPAGAVRSADAAAVAAAGAQHHDPAGQRDFYKQQFAQLRAELRSAAELSRTSS